MKDCATELIKRVAKAWATDEKLKAVKQKYTTDRLAAVTKHILAGTNIQSVLRKHTGTVNKNAAKANCALSAVTNGGLTREDRISEC